MNKPEFQAQIIRTEAQWRSGLFRCLEFATDHVTPFALPAFMSWVTNTDPFTNFGGLVSDDCGRLLWTASTGSNTKEVWHLYRYDPDLKLVENVVSLGSHREITSEKLWLTRDYLWVFDHSHGRVLGLSSENFQILIEIPITSNQDKTEKVKLIDLDFDHQSSFYAIVQQQEQYELRRYLVPPLVPGLAERVPFTNCQQPSVLAVAPRGTVYVVDTANGLLWRYPSSDGQKKEEQLKSHASDVLRHAESPIWIDSRGVLLLLRSSGASDEDKQVAEASKRLHAYDADGSYLGIIKPPPEEKTSPDGFAFALHDNLYWVTNQRIAKFTRSLTPPGRNGIYYSRTLDNGTVDGAWHRLSIQARLPPRTSITVSYFTSNEEGFKAFIDEAIDATGPVSEGAEKIERALGNRWKRDEFAGGSEDSPEQGNQHGHNPLDMLFVHNKGRYLWLKLELSTFDESQSPAINSLRVYYPRLSYLRYLPAIYRDDEESAPFVERFLSLFETIFHGLEDEIEHLFRYFDPQVTPAEFLPWLASWMNLSIGEDLPEERARELLRRAPDLFRQRGTPRGLENFLQAYTGRPAYVVEPSQSVHPFLLGHSMPLGVGTVVLGAPLRAIRLGDSSVVGRMTLRDKDEPPVEPFLAMTRRFVVMLDMDRGQFQRDQSRLVRIIDEQKPAHTTYTVRLLANEANVGSARIGVNATVTDFEPYRVGITPLGRAVPLAKGPSGPRVERGAWLGGSGKLL
ncbi:MAG: phage tail protein [Candidatus Binatia bacterium]